MNRCPRCGLKEFSGNKKEVLIDLLSTVCGKSVYYCTCPSSEKKKPKFRKANRYTEKRAKEIGGLFFKVWFLHNQPNMGDCRDLNYGYYITPENRVICDQGNIDITDEVIERFELEYKGGIQF